MVKEQLTDAMIDAGADLTSKLDEIGLPVVAAFWLFDPEIEEWRLFIASPHVSSPAPLAVYERIHQAMDLLDPKSAAILFLAVSVLEADHDLVKRLRVAKPTGPGIKRIRYSKRVAEGRYIHDALIYRAA